MPPETLSEKILARAAGLPPGSAAPGEVVTARVDTAMSHDNSALVIDAFAKVRGARLFEPSRIVIPLDHRTPADDVRTAELHKKIREFASRNGIASFFDVGEGICHQVLSEKGFALPGELVIGADSHSTTYGAFGAFGAGIGATEMAAVWATGELWLRIPHTIRVSVTGRIPDGVTPKDLTLHIVGELGTTGADYRAIEYHGSAIRALPVHGRMTLCNMGAEMGAKAAIVPPDGTTLSFLEGRARRPFVPVSPDPDARYERTVEIDGSRLEPAIALPGAVDDVVPVSRAAGQRIDQAFLGSCTNGRLEDLADAALIVKGRKIAPGVRFLVVPASRQVYLEAMRAGHVEALVAAGATILPPGCGPCLGGHQGILAKGEVCISGANRNFRGRMGDPDAQIFLGSPATVAASAIAGMIADPRPYLRGT